MADPHFASVIDTDTNCTPHLDALKTRGVKRIGRYYASKAWKRLTKTEAQAICAAGFELFTVFEDSGGPPLTIDQGRHDAQIAYSQARGVGQPEGSAIYFAMENLPSGYGPDDIAGLKLYFEGVRRVLKGLYKVGVYSNGTTLDALMDAKLCDYAWLSASLSFAGSRDFAKSDKWVLAQRSIDLNWSGVSVDTNEAKDDIGSFTLPAADGADDPLPVPAPTPPAPQHPIAIASKSPTIWSLIVGAVAAVGHGFQHLTDTISDLVGHIPEISNQVDEFSTPTTHILDIMRINSPEIGLAIGIACLCIAVARHIDLHLSKS